MTGPAPLIPPPIYATDREFFDLFLSQLFARSKRFRWCLQWQKHDEAEFVIHVLHDTYESTMASAPGEIGVWLRDYAYQLFFDRLCADDGTFSDCDWASDRHKDPMQLGTAE